MPYFRGERSLGEEARRNKKLQMVNMRQSSVIQKDLKKSVDALADYTKKNKMKY